MPFFVDSAGCQPASPFGIEMLGAAKPPLRQSFACGENACTAHPRRRPEGRVGIVLSP